MLQRNTVRSVPTHLACVGLLAVLCGAGSGVAIADAPDPTDQEQQYDATSEDDADTSSQYAAEYDDRSTHAYRARRDRDVRSDRRQYDGRQSRTPMNMALIAYDIDGDQRFDAYEYIFVEDLDAARQRSRSRMDYRRSRDAHRGGTEEGQRRQRRPRGFRIQGEVRDIRQVNLINMDQPHRIAKIDTPHGVVKADLGPRDDLDKLALTDGDRITVYGREGRINDCRMLIATRVESGEQKVTIARDRFNTHRKLTGRVIGIRDASFRETDEDHRVARVRTRQGRVERVDLGSRQSARSLDVSEGDEITVIGQRGRINGRPALFAHQVRINDGSIKTLSRVDHRGTRSSAALESAKAERQSGGGSADED